MTTAQITNRLLLLITNLLIQLNEEMSTHGENILGRDFTEERAILVEIKDIMVVDEDGEVKFRYDDNR